MGTALKYQLYDDPLKIFAAMIDDILNAKSSIFLQTYRFSNDDIGKRFRYVLLKKAKEGVKVKILIDSWGAGVTNSFFTDFIACGGKVKFFEKIKFSFDVFSRNHRRNHRKLLVVDQNISYIGSANITSHCLNWRESTLRIEGAIGGKFIEIINYDFDISNKVYQNKRDSIAKLNIENLNIIRDVPSLRVQPVRRFFIQAIRNAKKEVIIETPYFLPGSFLRKTLFKAALRGVNVKIIIPEHSDVMLFDILRNKYLGRYYHKNISIYLYTPDNLHAKVFIVDGNTFFTGSSNFDYRSMRFMHEVNIAGNTDEILLLLKNHIYETLNDCVKFDYEKWKNRHFFLKIIEVLLVPLRHLF